LCMKLMIRPILRKARRPPNLEKAVISPDGEYL